MGAATADVSIQDLFETERRIVGEHRCNVLLEGAPAATRAVLRLLQPKFLEPVRWYRPHAPLDLPGRRTRTLILRDVAGIDGADQLRLLAWSRGEGSEAQIISMTARPLFALVASGFFDAALYYRLNVILLRAGARRHPRLSRDDADNGLIASIVRPPSTLPLG